MVSCGEHALTWRHRLGIDGTWSTFDVQVGSQDTETVSLTVSTALSEIWIIENTGCGPSKSSCAIPEKGGIISQTRVHANPLTDVRRPSLYRGKRWRV